MDRPYLSYPGWKQHETIEAARAEASKDALFGAVFVASQDVERLAVKPLSYCRMTRTTCIERLGSCG
jgi:hypothetical protein